MHRTRNALLLAFALALGVAAGCSSSATPQCGATAPPDERAFWKTLAAELSQCLLSGSSGSCRISTEKKEWAPVSDATATRQQMHGVIAPGGSMYTSPTVAPEGDFCASHDDIDWNFNVTPDAADAWFLQPAADNGDADHPPGVFEAEWESMYVDPSFVAMPPGAGADYMSWGAPTVDMEVGDSVALAGAGVLDCGHAPYRSEIHPPYLLEWGGIRGLATVVFVRATAKLVRPSEFRSLPSPPDPTEALTESFPLPPASACSGGGMPSVEVTTSVDWLYDAPTITTDQGCDLTNGVSLTDLNGPAYDAALGSPAAHIEGTSDPSQASRFFTVTTDTTNGQLQVTVTPVARPHQVILGAHVLAVWSCPSG